MSLSRTGAAAERLWTRINPAFWVVLVAAIVTAIHFGIQMASLDPGVWSASTDDTYIGFQYARNLAKGYYFQYHPGDGYTSGFTCPIWAVFLVVPFLLGAKGMQLVPITIVYGGVFLAASMFFIIRVGRQLHNETAGKVAALLWGTWGYVWYCVYNGMESGLYVTMVLALVSAFIRWTRRPCPRSLWPLLALCALLPLARPDGLFLVCVLLGAVALRELVRWRSSGTAHADLVPALRTLALFAATLVPTAIYFASNKILTGTASSSGMWCKSLLHAPYLRWPEMVLQFVTQLLDTVKMFFTGADPLYLSFAVSFAGLTATLALGWRELARRLVGVYTLMAAFMIVTLLAGSAYHIRIAHWPRYYAPFYLFVFLGVGFALTWLARVLRRPGVVFGGALVLVFFQAYGSYHWAKIYDRDITITHTKQAAAGRTVAKLPQSSRVLICDAGAIPYIADRWTFDIVGLTSPVRYNYYRNGGGSRFELYERIPPARRPTHVAAYDFCLWPELRGTPIAVHHDLVVAPVIETGAGTGEQPAAPLAPGARVVDRVDVADLQSEAEHGHRVRPPGQFTDDFLRRGRAPGRKERISDGGRRVRGNEELFVRATAGQPMTLIGRFAIEKPTVLLVEVEGDVHSLKLAPTPHDAWSEASVEIPAARVKAKNRVRVRSQGEIPFAAFHYFVVQGGPSPARPAAP